MIKIIMVAFVIVMSIWLLVLVNKELPKERKENKTIVEKIKGMTAGDIFDDE